MKLLVHACCRHCLEIFDYNFKQIYPQQTYTVLFFNPNIHPQTEYLRRMQDVKIFCKEHNHVEFLGADYLVKKWEDLIIKKSKEPYIVPKNIRCPLCYAFRLRYLVNQAIEREYTHIYTTMLTSNYQDKQTITRILKGLTQNTPIRILDMPKFKQIKTIGFYKQNYCGCVFSLIEKMWGRE